MTRAEEVFAIFVAANPVPDVAVLEDDRVPASRLLSDVAEGGTPMRDITELENEDERQTGPPASRNIPARWRRPPLVAAAAFVAVLAIGAVWLLALAGSEDLGPAGPTTPPESIAPVATTAAPEATDTTLAPDPEAVEQQAVDTAEQFIAAVNAGDIETVMGLSFSSAANLEDELMWGFNAVLADNGYPIEVSGCEATSLGGTQASVRCATEMTDPLAAALGMSTVTLPFSYMAGQLAWRPFEGGNPGDLGTAYTEYLQRFQPDAYEAACGPAAFTPGTVVMNNGTALTPQCAEVIAPLLPDIAQWVLDGRP